MRQKNAFTSKPYTLRCFLMGVPRFFLDGRLSNSALSRKAQALLAYLAVTARPHTRDSLTTLLWPEMSDSRARKNLRTLLHTLRKPFANELEITTTTVTLIQAQCWVDVHVFRAAIAAQQPPAERILALEQALTLYQGKFLQNFHLRNVEPFEEWMHNEREQLQLQLIDGLTELVNHAVTTKQYKRGIAVARRLVTVDPWLENSHIKLIQLLVYNGQRAEALAQYEQYYQNIQSKFGMEPNAEIKTFVEQIRRQQSSPANLSHITTSTRGELLDPQTRGGNNNMLYPVPSLVPNNLARRSQRYFGREREVAFICRTLRESSCRLLTLTGPGGIGKTSLAIQAGLALLQEEQTSFPHGIFFVSLSTLRADYGHEHREYIKANPTPIPKQNRIDIRIAITIAEQIGLTLQSDIPVQAQLLSYLRRHQLLLILDDLEYLSEAGNTLDAGNAIVSLLTTAPKVKALLTARNRLHVRGETVLPLQGLSMPPMAIQGSMQGNQQINMADTQTLAMFTERAQQAVPPFAMTAANHSAVVRICQLAEGIPLCIELAAGMVAKVPADLLAEELTKQFAVLPPLPHTLRKEEQILQIIFDYCWEQISDAEQQLLTMLLLFPTTFAPIAAEVLVGTTETQLARLRNHFFLSRFPTGRYTMHRTIRYFLRPKSPAWPTAFPMLAIAFADYYLGFLHEKMNVRTGHQRREMVPTINVELDNIRTAWHYAVNNHMYSTLNKVCSELFSFYELQAYYTEAFDCFHEAYRHLSTAENATPKAVSSEGAPDSRSATTDQQLLPLLLGRLQALVGFFHYRLGRHAEAMATLDAGLMKLRKCNVAQHTLNALIMCAAIAKEYDLQKARVILAEALGLVRGQNLPTHESWLALLRGELEQRSGNFTQAEAYYQTGCTLAEQVDNEWALRKGRRLLGQLYSWMGRFAAAEATLEACIADDDSQTPKLIYTEVLVSLGELYRLQGDTQKAAQYYMASHELAEELQFQPALAQVTWCQAMLAEQMGDYAAARALFQESMALQPPGRPQLHRFPTLGWAYIGLEQLAMAYQCFEETFIQAQEQMLVPIQLDAQVGLIVTQWLQTQAYNAKAATLPVAQQSQLQAIYDNPATTQETRNRIVRLRGDTN